MPQVNVFSIFRADYSRNFLIFGFRLPLLINGKFFFILSYFCKVFSAERNLACFIKSMKFSVLENFCNCQVYSGFGKVIAFDFFFKVFCCINFRSCAVCKLSNHSNQKNHDPESHHQSNSFFLEKRPDQV